MAEKIYNLLIKYRQIIVYGLCSAFTCVLETIIGYILKNYVGIELIIANSASILIGAIIHYLLVTNKAFKLSISLWNCFVYIITFVLGFVLQNIVMKVSYDSILYILPELYRYTISKFASVVVPFFFVYYVRKYLYSIKIKKDKCRSEK